MDVRHQQQQQYSGGARNFLFLGGGGYSPGGLRDGSPQVGSRGEAQFTSRFSTSVFHGGGLSDVLGA